MYVTGKISAIDDKMPRVKIDVPEFDNITSGWFFVPQNCTVKDKSYNTMAIDTLVAAACSDDLQDGCIIGALYNDTDVCVLSDDNVKYIFFEDGTKIKYDKNAHELLINVVDKVTLNAVSSDFTTNLNLVGNLNVTGNITATGDITDKAYSMAAMREQYNAHAHGNGNNGANTTPPTALF